MKLGFASSPLVSPSSSMLRTGCFRFSPLSSLLHHLTLIGVVSPQPPKGRLQRSASLPSLCRKAGRGHCFGLQGAARAASNCQSPRFWQSSPQPACQGNIWQRQLPEKTQLTLFLPKAKFNSSGCYVRRPHSTDLLT